MRIFLYSLMGDQENLAGASLGQECFGRLHAAIRETSAPTTLFLDFEGISIATGSFLREGPLNYHRYARREIPNVYPVIANASSVVCDDLRLMLEARNDAMITCELTADGTVSNIQLIGHLDEKQRHTYELVRDYGQVTVAELVKRANVIDRVVPTAWNNRLAALVTRGVIMESHQGRGKIFTLPVRA